MVDLSTQLLRLVAPLSLHDHVIEGWIFVGLSTELGLRLSFAPASAPQRPSLHVELAPANTTARHAVATKRLRLSHRSPPGRPVPSAVGLRICAAVAQRVRQNEEAVLTALATSAATTSPSKIRELRVARVLEPAGEPDAPFETLSPYVGCLVGCRFCYAQSRLDPLRRLIGLPATPWGSYVDVRVNAAEVLREELKGRPPRPIKLCPIVSDPYQAVEHRYRLTRQCLETLRDASPSPPVLLLTRMAALAEDIPLLASLPRAFVGVSLPTIDDEVRRHFEPRAASVAERLELLAKLRAAGISTIAVVQPLLPGSHDALVEALASHVDSVSIDVLRGEEGARELFDDPRYASARDDAWQLDRARRLADELRGRGLEVWRGELPPALMQAGHG